MKQLKEFVACVTLEGKYIVLRSEYKTKKEFLRDIKDNGMKLKYSYIFTSEEYEDFKNGDGEITKRIEEKLNNIYWNNKKQQRIKQLRKEENL